MPWLVLPAPSGPRAQKKGADHRPRARQWPGYVRRGTGGASNCTNGSNYGPATTKSAQMGLARGFARWLLRDDPDRDDGIFSAEVKHPNGRPGGCERGKVGLAVGGAPEDRSGTRVYLGLVVEMASTNARASLLALTPPTGMPALPDPPQHTQR